MKTLVRKVVKSEEKKPEVCRVVISTDDDSEYVALIKKGNITLWEFRFQVEPTPFCCGLAEIGSFDSSNQRNAVVAKTDKLEAVRQLMQRLIDNYSEGEVCKTLVFTLINETTCNLVKEALADENLFMEVKSFINSNSGTKNHLYVSVN